MSSYLLFSYHVYILTNPQIQVCVYYIYSKNGAKDSYNIQASNNALGDAGFGSGNASSCHELQAHQMYCRAEPKGKPLSPTPKTSAKSGTVRPYYIALPPLCSHTAFSWVFVCKGCVINRKIKLHSLSVLFWLQLVKITRASPYESLVNTGIIYTLSNADILHVPRSRTSM